MLEYEYPKKMDLHSLSCIGLHYSLTGYDSIVTNFTFRFPAKTGHFYHLPTFALVTDQQRAVWEMQFRGGRDNLEHSIRTVYTTGLLGKTAFLRYYLFPTSIDIIKYSIRT